MTVQYRTRRIVGIISFAVMIGGWLVFNRPSVEQIATNVEQNSAFIAQAPENVEPLGVGTAGQVDESKLARNVLEQLEVKGRAPKTDYSREQFYKNWPTINGCSLRQIIIKREFGDSAVLDECNVIAGKYYEPYTGAEKIFTEKSEISKKIQIDHVVALSDAWQKGAQYMDETMRYNIATDPLNLLAVDSSANQQKSDGDAATWLPPNKGFRCQYVARQISVKKKYGLWLTQAEHDAIAKVLESCPNESVVGI